MGQGEDGFVVIDTGSYTTKAGMGVSDTNKPPSVIVSMTDTRPIKNGIVQDWDALAAIWKDILFKELGIKRSRNEHPVLFTVPALWTKYDHERIARIAFEELNVPAMYIAPQPMLALFGCKSSKGMVVDIGEETTDISIVVDAVVLPQTCFMIPLGGRQFDQYLAKVLKAEDTTLVEQFRNAGMELDEEFARFIREKDRVCVPSVDHEEITDEVSIAAIAKDEAIEDETEANTSSEDDTKDLPETAEVEYKGHTFTVGKSRHKAYDPLFSLDLIGQEGISLGEAMMESQRKCEFHPAEIWKNIVLTGGCSRAIGLQKRVESELQNFLSRQNADDYKVIFRRIPDYFPVLKEKENQHYSTWLGGEITAKLVFADEKNKIMVHKKDYSEQGPSIIHRK